MRRYACNHDEKHKAILDGLRKAGFKAYSWDNGPPGAPDIVVGARGRNLLLEVKRALKRKPRKLGPVEKHGNRLNADQETWHATWTGQVAVVDSPIAAVELVLRLSRGEASHG